MNINCPYTFSAVVSAAIARSMTDLAFAAARAGSGAGESRSKVEAEKKAKKGFLSFLGKKDNKFKLVCIAMVNACF